MNYSLLRIWLIVTFTFAVVAVVIRSIWQIAVIPTPGTMRIFILLIIALLFANALLAYIIVNFSMKKLASLPVIIGVTAALTAGVVAGVSHSVHFIISPQSDPSLSKVIGSFVLLSSPVPTFWCSGLSGRLGRKGEGDLGHQMERDRLWIRKDLSGW